MSTVSLLDCTLRDGGNQNSWRFTPEHVTTVVESLDQAGIPFIEVGYRGGSGSNTSESVGASARCDADYLASLPNPKTARYAAMVVPSVCPLDSALALSGSPVSFVRVAVYPWDAALAPRYVEELRGAGLTVSVNLMALSYTDDAELESIASLFRDDAAPDVFYVADSFGALTPSEVSQRVQLLGVIVDADIGVHFHNNLGLAAANTLAAIEAGATWIDGSLAGMARGAGNLATEQAVAILEAVGANTSAMNAEAAATTAEYIADYVLASPMKSSRNELLAGLNNHHYYFQSHINDVSKELSVNARELGRRVGSARLRKVTRDAVLSIASEMKAEHQYA